MLEQVYQKISALFPRKLVMETGKIMRQGGFTELSPRVYLGFALFFSLTFALAVFFSVPFISDNKLAQTLAPLVAFVASAGGFYILLVLSADSRAQQVEGVLPEVLQIISANIRAGMTLENAIWTAARPEFGPLRDEIKRVSADTFGGIPITETLSRMTERVRSSILERSIKLVVEGIKLGGEMAHLLDEVAVDIRSVQLLRKEITTSTTMYVIFIMFSAVLAAPLLFSISTFYSEMNEKVLAKRTQGGSGQVSEAAVQQSGLGALAKLGQGGSKKTEDGIAASDIYWFSALSIVITNFFAALTLGLIQHGNATRGIKFAPIFVPAALGIYILVLSAMRAAFGTLLK